MTPAPQTAEALELDICLGGVHEKDASELHSWLSAAPQQGAGEQAQGEGAHGSASSGSGAGAGAGPAGAPREYGGCGGVGTSDADAGGVGREGATLRGAARGGPLHVEADSAGARTRMLRGHFKVLFKSAPKGVRQDNGHELPDAGGAVVGSGGVGVDASGTDAAVERLLHLPALLRRRMVWEQPKLLLAVDSLRSKRVTDLAQVEPAAESLQGGLVVTPGLPTRRSTPGLVAEFLQRESQASVPCPEPTALPPLRLSATVFADGVGVCVPLPQGDSNGIGTAAPIMGSGLEIPPSAAACMYVELVRQLLLRRLAVA